MIVQRIKDSNFNNMVVVAAAGDKKKHVLGKFRIVILLVVNG